MQSLHVMLADPSLLYECFLFTWLVEPTAVVNGGAETDNVTMCSLRRECEEAFIQCVAISCMFKKSLNMCNQTVQLHSVTCHEASPLHSHLFKQSSPLPPNRPMYLSIAGPGFHGGAAPPGPT